MYNLNEDLKNKNSKLLITIEEKIKLLTECNIECNNLRNNAIYAEERITNLNNELKYQTELS